MADLFHENVIKPHRKATMRGEPHHITAAPDNGLMEAGRAIVADAQFALTTPNFTEAERVHALRRAFKRWRALLRLLRRPAGPAADAMRAEARELMRQLATARDQQSALDALDDLAKGEAPISPRSLASMRERLTASRAAAEAEAMTPDLRARIDSYLGKASNALELWLLPQVPFDMITDALATTYRGGRKLIPNDWMQADPEHLHALRRRVVEHRHQMELIEPLWPRFAKMWGEEAQRLRNQLGACQDLAVLSGFLAPHQPLAHWRARITPAIAERRAAHLRSAARLAGRLFAEKPRAFRKRIAALWDARQTPGA